MSRRVDFWACFRGWVTVVLQGLALLIVHLVWKQGRHAAFETRGLIIPSVPYQAYLRTHVAAGDYLPM